MYNPYDIVLFLEILHVRHVFRGVQLPSSNFRDRASKINAAHDHPASSFIYFMTVNITSIDYI